MRTAEIEEILRQVHAPISARLEEIDERRCEPKAPTTVVDREITRPQAVLQQKLEQLGLVAQRPRRRTDGGMPLARPDLGHDPVHVILLVGRGRMAQSPAPIVQRPANPRLKFHEAKPEWSEKSAGT